MCGAERIRPKLRSQGLFVLRDDAYKSLARLLQSTRLHGAIEILTVRRSEGH